MNEQKKTLITRIHEDIRNGSIVRSKKLFSERELCEIYGVKRSQIREALIALETLGIIEIVERNGMFVTENHRQALAESLGSLSSYSPIMLHSKSIEARLIIEPQCAAVAARKCTEENEHVLRSEISFMKALYQDSTKDINEQAELCYRHNIIIHNTIIEMADNVVLTNIYHYLADISREVFSVLGQQTDGLRPYALWPEVLMKEHEDIVDAIVRHDEAAASKAMLTHLSNSQNRNTAMMAEKHMDQTMSYPVVSEI